MRKIRVCMTLAHNYMRIIDDAIVVNRNEGDTKVAEALTYIRYNVLGFDKFVGVASWDPHIFGQRGDPKDLFEVLRAVSSATATVMSEHAEKTCMLMMLVEKSNPFAMRMRRLMNGRGLTNDVFKYTCCDTLSDPDCEKIYIY